MQACSKKYVATASASHTSPRQLQQLPPTREVKPPARCLSVGRLRLFDSGRRRRLRGGVGAHATAASTPQHSQSTYC